MSIPKFFKTICNAFQGEYIKKLKPSLKQSTAMQKSPRFGFGGVVFKKRKKSQKQKSWHKSLRNGYLYGKICANGRQFLMIHYIYPAVFFKSEDEYKVLIPDLNLTTEGNNIEEAYLYAKDYLRAYCTYALKFDMDVEFPSKFEDIAKKYKNANTMLLSVSLCEKDVKKK